MHKFFNQRNKKISNLNLMADSLGHALRENVSFFSVDDVDSVATFITESGVIIQGNYYFGDNMILDNILVESGEVFSDESKFDDANKSQVFSFVNSIYSDELADAGTTFNNILESWNSRIKFNKTVERLQEQSESFNNTFNILDTDEFGRFLEVSENISKFLSENKDSIEQIPEIVNAVRLSNTVAAAFNIPRLTLDELADRKSFDVSLSENRDIYEMVCRQELVSREIIESKKSFDTIWATEPCISNLATKIYSEEEEVAKALVEAVIEIPYLSLVSKGNLSSTISKCLDTLHESISYSKSDLKDFVATLFEMKKPLKQMVSSMLQEKYGVNVNNLKDTPTFKTLLNTQVLIFESLAKLAPRGSVIKESLSNLSEMLKSKNGVEAIDVNNGIKFLFTESGYDSIYVDQSIASTFSLNESMVEDKAEFVDMILGDLILEKKEEKKKKEEKNKKKEEEEEEEKKESKAEDESESIEETEESAMSTKELMDALSEIESIIDDPVLEDE